MAGPDKPPSATNENLEREIRQARKFDPKEALARMAGPGAMKGASPVSPVQQAETEIGTWLRGHLEDQAGALHVPLHRHLRGSKLLLDSVDRPLAALAKYCRYVLASDYLLAELVREADVEWGRRMDEPPYFAREGSADRPGDPYTVESVRKVLAQALVRLEGVTG